ncbi:hypothetical protein M0805_002107 [Coniferiporia weirii]|nr:hypothetical protein M0805_002107 [Coniferiporia weirii]
MSSVAVAGTLGGLRDVHGRGMNVHSDVYKLPADTEEHDRLTIQHRIWKLLIGGSGLYPSDVEEIVAGLLAPKSDSMDESVRPSVLDLGSGSGIWAAEMAIMYPHSKVVGLDLAEPKLQSIPENCSFVTADATKGLNEYAESFDIVHCRCVAGHVIDRTELMRVIATVLKPDGLLLLADGNGHVYAPDRQPIPSADTAGESTTGGWIGRWLAESVGRMLSLSVDPEKAGGGFLEYHVQNEPGLEFLGKRAYYSPVRWSGPADATSALSAQDEVEQEIARLTERNMLYFLASGKPLLLSSGIPSATVDDWQRRASADILEPPVCWSLKWDLAWATKRV